MCKLCAQTTQFTKPETEHGTLELEMEIALLYLVAHIAWLMPYCNVESNYNSMNYLDLYFVFFKNTKYGCACSAYSSRIS